jgi:hypothetical protein
MKPSKNEAEQILVAFDPSHSNLKIADIWGTRLIAAGWRTNPVGRIINVRDEQNPLIVVHGDGSVIKRLYGETVCQQAHETALDRRKEVEARLSLAACLRPEYHNSQLVVVASHWDENVSPKLKELLIGGYHVTRNGKEIRCQVVDVIPETEGMGAFWLTKSQHNPGNVLLIELGYGTAEFWEVASSGQIVGGDASSETSVSKLVETIANDDIIRATSIGNIEGGVNRDFISAALKHNIYPKLDPKIWQALRLKHEKPWVESFRNYIKRVFGPSETIGTIVISGGGASIIQKHLPNGKFIIPSDPQTASVRGLFQRYTELAKGASS